MLGRAAARPVYLLLVFFVPFDIFTADWFAFFMDFFSTLKMIFSLWNRSALCYLNMIEERNNRSFNRFYHFFKHFIGFKFIFDKRIFLAVCTQVNAFF